MPIRLFTYGTLQNGYAESARLNVIDGIPGTIEGFRLYDSGLGWPFVSIGQEGEIVHGQILTLVGDEASADDMTSAFAQADNWEGYNPEDPARSLFIREQIPAKTEIGERVQAFAYFSSAEWIALRYPDINVTRIEGGVWIPQ
jgi:gamma-glutamylcyclotransferase (GGCT)/AIG2-like uncharacterized protein YtfP